MGNVSIGVLGPIELSGSDGPIDLGGRRQRRLLAALSANAPDVISVDGLAEIVWEGSPSDAADRTLQSYVSRLRRSFEAAGVVDGTNAVLRAEPGYSLGVADLRFDAAVFEQHLDDAIAANAGGDPARAVLLLDEAERLWRGRAYAEFADEEWIRPEVERLEELRVVAVEKRVDARLALGAHAEVIAELERLVRDQPLRDRPRRQLMLALYRSGRQADSLRAFQAYRDLLADEVGLEPTDELRELERQVASNDPSLAYDPTTGRSLRGYQLYEQLGSGAFATVIRGTQPSVGREVAIKVIRSELANRPEFIRAFEVEAQLVAYLEHPYIVPLYDFWREPDRAYLVMRLMRGGRLESRLATHPLSLSETRKLVTDVGDALAYSHRAGVVHRDVKSANVLLDGEGNYYVGDFGIAMELSGSHSDQVVLSFGSPAYASPEQLRRQPVGFATDIFGFGVLVFEALTGTLPFDTSSSTAELVSQLDTRRLPDISTRRPGMPEALDAVLRRATAVHPTDRHPDVEAFVTDFLAALDGSAGIAAPPTARGRATVRAVSSVNPYKGLRPFTEADSADFHGREALVDSLLDRLDGDDVLHRLVTVVGPSGSGKSSVVRAGLLPALRRGRVTGSEDWYVTTMTPGGAPFDELESALLRVAVNPPEQLLGQLTADERGVLRSTRRILPDEHTQLLVVIDQFEELFVLAPEDVRRRFLAALAVAVTDPRSQLRVVATLRADFYDRPLSSPEFAELTRASAITVTPLAPDEVEQAVVAPARAAGCEFEEGLVPEILVDVAQGSGTLPLLQYALTELYEQRSDSGLLTRASYEDLGGVIGALAVRADELMASMSPTHRDAARRLFLRLVTVGERAADTRRRMTRSEVGADRDMVEVINVFGDARLLSFDRDGESREPTVEVAHEALITQWPSLRDWIDSGREGLRIHRHLTQTASEWESADRETGELYRGARLHAALEWADGHGIDLNPSERDFLDASQELHLAEEHKERRRIRRLRTLLAAVGIVAVVAVAAGLLALRAQRDANASADRARARELGIAAINELRDDPELGLLLAIEAASIDDDVPTEVIDALHQSLQALRVEFTVISPGGPGLSSAGGVAYSPDGTRLATTGDGVSVAIWDAGTGAEVATVGLEPPESGAGLYPEVAWYGPDQVVTYGGSAVEVWDVTTGELIHRMPSTGPGAGTIASDADAQRIVTAGFADAIRVWNPSSGDALRQTQPSDSNYGVAINPTGTTLVAASDDNNAYIYDLETLDVRFVLTGHTAGLIDATFSPDGSIIVTTSNDGSARVWSADDEPQLLRVFEAHTGGVVSTEFSPDGRLVATAANDGRILIWEADTGTVQLELTGLAGLPGQLSWHPDGNELAVASGGGVTQVFDVTPQGSREVLTIDTGSAVRRADISPDGDLIATIGDDQTARIFSAHTGAPVAVLPPTGPMLPASDEGWVVPDEDIRFSPDGELLAVGNDRGVVLWEVERAIELLRLDDLTVRVHGLAWSSDGDQIATTGRDGTARIWAVATGDLLGSVGNDITSVTYGPFEHRLLTGGNGGPVERWSATPGEPLRRLDALFGTLDAPVNRIDASPDRSMIAVAYRDTVVGLWNGATLEERLLREPGDVVVLDVSFSPDSRLLATATENGSATIWDSQSEERLQSLVGHTGLVGSVVFVSDGKTVMTAGEDGIVRLHLVDVPALVELAQSRVTRPFSAQECTRFRLESALCPEPANGPALDEAEPEPTDPAEARAALEEIADAIAADDVSRALQPFSSDAVVGGWVLDTERFPGAGFSCCGQLSDADVRDTFRGGLEIAAARAARMHGIECNQSVDGSVSCIYAVAGWVDPTRPLIMNVLVEVREGRITGWFNYSPGGPGYDDFRAWMAFLDQQSDEGLRDCLELALNDRSCVEVVAPFLDEFRQTTD